ncbi:MAG: DUF2769 domain-containing protein [Patescibacteria group bacterium]
MPKIDFNLDNIKKCQCLNCPVQAKSKCVEDKTKTLKGILSLVTLKSEAVPKVYCSQGQATCKDLDFNESCICPTCAVWTENGLKSYHYCQKGNAEEIG